MAHMVEFEFRRANISIKSTANYAGRSLIVLLFVFFSCKAHAGEWVVTPSLDLAEIYSDNINLSSTRPTSDFITEVNPGISLSGTGSRIKASLDYRMRNLVFLNNSNSNSISHQLLGNALAELTRNYLYVDVNSSISQALIRPSVSVPLTGVTSGNVSNVYMYGIKPYFQHNFGNLYTVYAGYGYQKVRYSNGGANNAIIRDGTVKINNGARFTRLTWGLSYKNEKTIREPSNNFLRKTASGNVSYKVTDSIKTLAIAGKDEYSFTASQQAFANGTYWAAGLGWAPGRKFSIDGLYGTRYKSASLTISPTSHTSLHVQWLKRSVGLSPGVQWNGSLRLRTRRSNWLASYFQDTTTSQALAFSSQGSGFYDPVTGQLYPAVRDPATGGLVPIDPATGQPVPVSLRSHLIFGAVGNFGITNQAFTRKRGQISYGFNTGRTNISLSYYRENRKFLISNDVTIGTGYNASVGWRMTALSEIILAANRTNYQFSSGRDDKSYLYSIAINTRFNSKVTGLLSLQRRGLKSNQASSGYTENRVTAGLNMTF